MKNYNTCIDFWKYADKSIIGIGNIPIEAINDLKNKLFK